MNKQLATGYTFVAVVFLAELAYALQISANQSAASLPLTSAFLGLNVLGWCLGRMARSRRRGSPPSDILFLLGDALFPLNLYGPFLLYVPHLQGRVFHSASLVLLLGMLNHILGYMRPGMSRFPRSFYPYFFAGAGAGLLFLLRFTVGASPEAVLSAMLAFGLLLHTLAERFALEPRGDFAVAVVSLLVGVIGTAAVFLIGHRTPTLLILIVLASVAVGWLAVSARAVGTRGRLFAFVWYGALTASFTAGLYYAAAPPALYIIATTAWVIVLCGVSAMLPEKWAVWLGDGAHWMSTLIGVGLVLYLTPAWLPVVGGGAVLRVLPTLPASLASPDAGGIVGLALAGVGSALLFGSFWRARYPSIAFSVVGFIASSAYLTVTSYLGPVLIIAAVAVLCPALGSTAVVAAWSLFAIGAGVLTLLAPVTGRVYSRPALDTAGTVGLLLAIAAVVADSGSTLLLLAGVACVLQVRAIRGASLRWHLASLVVATAAAVGAGTTTGAMEERMLPLSVLALVLIALHQRLAATETSRIRGWVTLLWAMSVGAIVVVAEIAFGYFSIPLLLSLAVGFLVGLEIAPAHSMAQRHGESGIRRLGHAVTFAAGGALLIAILRACHVAVAYDGIALAAWAWGHHGVSRALVAWTPERAVTRPAGYAVHGFALLAIGCGLAASNRVVAMLSALSYAVLCFQRAGTAPGAPKGLRRAGYALIAATTAGVLLDGDPRVTLVALSVSAAIFLWRSFTTGSETAHCLLLISATGAGIAFAATSRGDLLFLAILTPALLVIARVVRSIEGHNHKVDHTLQWALIVGGGVVVTEMAFGRRSPEILATVWLGLAAGLAGWDRRSTRTSALITLAIADRRHRAVSGDEWLQIVGFWVAHVAGMGLLLAVLQRYGAPPAYSGVAVAGWAVLHYCAALGLARYMPGRAVGTVTHSAVHAFATLALVLAAAQWRSGTPAIAACGAVGLLYVVARGVSKRPVLEHIAGAAFVEALVLVGMSRHIAHPEYYLTSVALYLCVSLFLRAPWGVSGTPLTETHRPFRWDRGSLLALTVLILAVLYPFAALVISHTGEHMLFLGGASVMLLWTFLSSGQQPIFVYVVCTLFVLGVVDVVAFGNLNHEVNAFLVVVGSLGIASLRLMGSHRELHGIIARRK